MLPSVAVSFFQYIELVKVPPSHLDFPLNLPNKTSLSKIASNASFLLDHERFKQHANSLTGFWLTSLDQGKIKNGFVD